MIKLTDEMRAKLASALADGVPTIAASVDLNGQPKLTFYGSTHVHADDQLAIWVRDPNSGVLTRIATNPRMSFLYRNPPERIRWMFEGRARVVVDDEERDRVYAETPEFERLMDADRKGRAVVIDLDKVTGRDIDMSRD